MREGDSRCAQAGKHTNTIVTISFYRVHTQKTRDIQTFSYISTFVTTTQYIYICIIARGTWYGGTQSEKFKFEFLLRGFEGRPIFGNVDGSWRVTSKLRSSTLIQVARRRSKVFQRFSASLVRVGDVQGVPRRQPCEVALCTVPGYKTLTFPIYQKIYQKNSLRDHWGGDQVELTSCPWF